MSESEYRNDRQIEHSSRDGRAVRRTGGAALLLSRRGIDMFDVERRTGPIVADISPEDIGAWQRYANCIQTSPEVFFPEHGASPRDAKRVCEGCDVREQCLQYALKNDEKFGIWGGLTEEERAKLKTRARRLIKWQAGTIEA